MPGTPDYGDTFWIVAGIGVNLRRRGTEGDIIKVEKAKWMSRGLGYRLMGEAGKMRSDVQDEWANGKQRGWRPCKDKVCSRLGVLDRMSPSEALTFLNVERGHLVNERESPHCWRGW